MVTKKRPMMVTKRSEVEYTRLDYKMHVCHTTVIAARLRDSRYTFPTPESFHCILQPVEEKNTTDTLSSYARTHSELVSLQFAEL